MTIEIPPGCADKKCLIRRALVNSPEQLASRTVVQICQDCRKFPIVDPFDYYLGLVEVSSGDKSKGEEDSGQGL